MNRRTFLGAVGSVASLGALGYASREPVDGIEIRFWLSERAASYGGVVERLREYLEFAFDRDLEFWTADVSYGGVVEVDTEDGYRVTTGGQWPRILLSGAVGRESVDPANDVNLLVTDGQMETTPTGAGLPHVASVGGARHIADLRPIDDRTTVPYADSTRAMHIAIHEAGHALGLEHDHGVAFVRGDAVVATPMLSAYAWDPNHEDDRSRCGTDYPPAAGTVRRLTYSFSSCARRQLRAYSGGWTP